MGSNLDIYTTDSPSWLKPQLYIYILVQLVQPIDIYIKYTDSVDWLRLKSSILHYIYTKLHTILHLYYIYTTSIQHLYNIYTTSILHLYYIYTTSILHLYYIYTTTMLYYTL